MQSQSRALLVAAGLILGLAALRLFVAQRLGLGDVEAYYWTWSRELSLGYLDHGPLVALLVRLGTALLGDTPLGVRLAFIGISALSMWILAALACRVGGSGARGGLWATVTLLCLPMFLVAGGAANPDVPFSLLVVLFLAILLRGSSVAHLALAGLVVGVAFCAKYFAVLLLLPLLATALRGPARRLAAVAASLGAALVGALPVLLWNASHGWSSFTYHLVGRHARPAGPSLENLGKLVGGQLAYVSPLVLAGLVAAGISLWRRRQDPVAALLLMTAASLLAGGYLLILVVPSAEPHWPAAGYLPLVVWLGARLPQWLARRPVRQLAAATVALAALLAVGLHVHALTDAGVRRMPSSYVPRYDLTNELYGWDAVAEAAAAPARPPASVAAAVGCHYTTCSQLAFAARGRFVVRCPSPRVDQFDFSAGGDGAAELVGKSVLYVRDERFPFDAGQLYRCAGVRPRGEVIVRRGGRIIRRFRLDLCVGFAGLKTATWPPARTAEVAPNT